MIFVLKTMGIGKVSCCSSSLQIYLLIHLYVPQWQMLHHWQNKQEDNEEADPW